MEPNPDHDLATTSIDIAGPPDAVWQALVTNDGLEPWLGRGAIIEPTEGGLLSAPDPVGGRTRRGRVERIDEGRRLELVWWPATNPAERSTVTIELEPIHDPAQDSGADEREPGPVRTRLTVTETVPSSVLRRSSARMTAAPARVGAWSWRLALFAVGFEAMLSVAGRSVPA